MKLLLLLLIFAPGLVLAESVIRCQIGHGAPSGRISKGLEIAAKKIIPFKENESYGNDWKKYIQVLASKEGISFVYENQVLVNIAAAQELCGWQLSPANDDKLADAAIIQNDFKFDQNGFDMHRVASVRLKTFPMDINVDLSVSVKLSSGVGSIRCEAEPVGDKRYLLLRQCRAL